jgi:hypothetical protein
VLFCSVSGSFDEIQDIKEERRDIFEAFWSKNFRV